MQKTFMGYRRDNGRVGIRNHVVILPLDDLSNAACEAVANNVKGTIALPHAYGRLQFGADLDLHFRTLIGTGSNPTVGNAFDKLYEAGCTTAFGETTELTGGEHLVAARCANDDVRKKFQAFFDRYQKVVEDHKTNDLCDSQPTKGNIEGGLTTIEEKALGNIQKIGRKAPIVGCLDKAETPTGPGLWFMDTSSAAAEAVTLFCAGGYVAHFFPTGQGNIIGNPIEPVIKLTGNPRTLRTMSEHIDVDVTGILRREMNYDQAGDKLLDMLISTCNGRMTSAEVLGHREFIMTRLYESA